MWTDTHGFGPFSKELGTGGQQGCYGTCGGQSFSRTAGVGVIYWIGEWGGGMWLWLWGRWKLFRTADPGWAPGAEQERKAQSAGCPRGTLQVSRCSLAVQGNRWRQMRQKEKAGDGGWMFAGCWHKQPWWRLWECGHVGYCWGDQQSHGLQGCWAVTQHGSNALYLLARYPPCVPYLSHFWVFSYMLFHSPFLLPSPSNAGLDITPGKMFLIVLCSWTLHHVHTHLLCCRGLFMDLWHLWVGRFLECKAVPGTWQSTWHTEGEPVLAHWTYNCSAALLLA